MLAAHRRRSPAARAASLFALALLSPSLAAAADFSLFGRSFSLRGANTLEYAYHLDNDGQDDPPGLTEADDEYHEVFNTLDVTLSSGDVRLGGRFDFYTYAARPFDRLCGANAPAATGEPSWCNQRGTRYVNQYLLYRERAIMPERLFFEVSRPEMDVVLGDFYATLGKGLALSAIKRDELGQDLAIRGGKLSIHHADFGLIFLAGEFNPLDIDNATGRVAPWAAEPVIGGQIEQRFFDSLLLGAHGSLVISDGAESNVARTDHHAIYGLRAEAADLLSGKLSVGAEVDLQRTVEAGEVVRGPDHDAGGGLFSARRGDGLAVYGTSTLQLGDWTLLAEVKHYDDFFLRGPKDPLEPYVLLYHQPPTLERIRSEVTDNQSTTGTRLRADWSLSEELLLFVSYAYFATRSEGVHQIHDPYAGVEISWSEGDGHLNVTAGVRHERNADRDALYRLDIHAEADFEQALWAAHSMKLSAYYQHRRKEIGSWDELDTALEYRWAPRIALGLTVELQGDATVGYQDTVYVGGSLRYFFTPSTYIGARAGQNRGGLKCLSGSCRIFPPFAGFRAFAVAQF